MKKVAFVIYRKWAYQIYKKIKKRFRKEITVELITPRLKEFKDSKSIIVSPTNNKKLYSLLKKKKIEIVFFYGWSWIVNEKIYKNFLSFCLHPSNLPKYKGGSPIQHQIINNLKSSAVTVFKLSNKIDGGDIFKKKKISLVGSLKNIFSKISKSGYEITSDLIINYFRSELKLKKQQQNNFKVLRRRKAEESEIKLIEISKKSFTYLNNHIRMLDDPYPNSFIKLKNKKVLIKKIKKFKKNKYHKLISNNLIFKRNLNGYFIRLIDCNAKIIKSILC